ncbi:MAG: hypothetical protein ACRCWY_11855 [Cellulosilyticaceae bacterium]
MNAFPITTLSADISVGQECSLTITEPECPNCNWEIDFPSGLILLSMNKLSDTLPGSTQWVFKATHAGTYTLTFRYRKRCCGRPILKTQINTIIVH